MSGPARVRHPGLWLGVVAVVAAGAALWLFPRAMPLLTLGQRLTRQAALAHADSFFRVHDLAPAGAQTAVRFESNDRLQTYVDLAGGGRDTLEALARGSDVALYVWSVRAFVPRDPHEARVDFATDGRIVGFHRVFAEADKRPEVTDSAGLAMAEGVIAGWLREDTTRWRLVTSSYDTKKASGRVDRTYTFERRSRRIADAPIRLDVVIAGDTPSEAHPYVVIPETFSRRYGAMRAANNLLALIAQGVGMVGLLILGVLVLRHYGLEGSVRWKPALLLGGVIGVLIAASVLNELPGSWFGYDTATSPMTFRAMQILSAVLSGAGMALLVGLTVAAAEAAARHAFPGHPDWWKVWKERGTREVAGRVATGYVVALVGLAYVSFFYLVTRHLLGWWVPSELVDDPNLIATPMPWLSGVAAAVQAGVWEESLFRALPLSLLALWARRREHFGRWMAAGVVGTALVFGFSHSNYESWPAYSRGVEIFLDACLWAVLFVWLGLVVTVLTHFTYDLLLFGMFAASGSAPAYRVSAVVIALVLLAPALAVGWRWLRQGRLRDLADEARFGAWEPAPARPPAPHPAAGSQRALSRQARAAAPVVSLVALLLVIFVPTAPTLGRPFTATRSRALATADSMARAHGLDPASWHRLSTTAADTLTGLTRFLVQRHADSLAQKLADSYEPPAWWVVRYVHTGGTVADRVEEWRMRLWPDGSRLDTHHLVPDSAKGDTVSDAEARTLARSAIVAAGLDTLTLQETRLDAVERPARRDVTVTYTDTAMKLPGDAAAQVRVTLAGDQPLVVRRGVELPEAFRRAQRERRSTDGVLLLVCSTWILGLVLLSVVLVVRRREPLVDDGVLGRKASLAVVGVLTVLGAASILNGLPSRLFGYDTAMPWSNWLAVNGVIVVLGAALPALLALGLWLALTALRRRVGIPLLPRGEGAGGRPDVLLAGLGLGSMLFLTGLALRLANRGPVPAPPATLLDQAVPVLGGAVDVPLDVVMTVTMLAIPALALAGIARRWSTRLLGIALLVVPVLAVLWVQAPPASNADVRTFVPAVVGLVALVLSVRWWAGYSGWSWVVGGTVWAAFGGAWSLLHSATGVEREAGALTVLTALALFALAARAAGRWRNALEGTVRAGPSGPLVPAAGGGAPLPPPDPAPSPPAAAP
jgi:hypothetical protein